MPATDRSHQFALTLSCPSAAGQVAAVVGFLERHHCYVDELTVFDDDIRFALAPTLTALVVDETLDFRLVVHRYYL